MSFWSGPLPVTIAAAAVATAADVPGRVILRGRGENFPDCGCVLEDADYAWLRE